MVYTGKESAVMGFPERIVPGLLAVVVLLISNAGCVEDQAPGDGVAICTDEIVNGMPNPFFVNRPVYSVNERPLMDSRDYNRLLQSSGDAYVPWQSLDRDNNNTNMVVTEWTQTGSATCAGTVTVCGFSEGAQENWLITQHINTVLQGGGGERLRKVTVQFEGILNGCDITRQCRQSFELYKWETSAIDRNGATNTNNHVRVGRVSPAVTSGVMSFVGYHDIELGNTGGFYLGVVDLSTCVTLTRILILYYVCPEETSELISRPEAIESQSLEGSPSVEGECVENSSTESGANPILVCGARGQWQVIQSCVCKPGYQLNSSQDKCSECPEGTFSSGLGNGPCETCPANSDWTGTALSLCPCLQDYYRAPYEGPSVSCTQSPGRPSDVRVSNVTNTSAVLSWSPPDNGGGRPLYEIVYTVTGSDRGGSGGERVLVSEVNDTETIVTGLTPGVLYTFSVSAENDVSSQDNNINARSLSTTANTQEGVGGTVTEFVVGENGVLSWSSPVPPNGVILYYNVIISTADSGQLVTRVGELDVLTIDVSNYGEMNMDYNVTVQAVTSVGGGDFSSPVTISLREPSPDSNSNEAGVIAGAVVAVTLTLGLIVAALCAFICWTRMKIKKRRNLKNISSTDINIELRKEPDVSEPDMPDPVMKSDEGLFVPQSSITIQNVIGEGQFGIVYKALLHNWKGYIRDVVAAKTLKGLFSSHDVKHLEEESKKMARFDHPNVMKLIGVSLSMDTIPFLVMPYMANGSLLSYLRKNRPELTVKNGMTELITENGSRLLSMCLQIAKGMEYLASKKFVHRDLAARNCMIDLNNVIKVADFGLSEDIYARNYFRQGGRQEENGEGPVKLPVKWMALESLNDGVFSEKSDVWSFGVTCWEVFSLGKNPYPGVDPFSLIRYLERGERLDKPLNAACSQEVFDIMSECWEEDPGDRPTFSQLVTVISTRLEGMAGYVELNKHSKLV